MLINVGWHKGKGGCVAASWIQNSQSSVPGLLLSSVSVCVSFHVSSLRSGGFSSGFSGLPALPQNITSDFKSPLDVNE